MHVLSATGLTKSFDDRDLFRGVALGVATGDRVGLVGPNGSGKSTLLRILAGAVQPDSGEVVHAAGARVRYLAQEPDLLPGPAVDAVLAAGDEHVRRDEAEAMLRRLGVEPDAETTAMSGGQRRRVAIAATLLPPSHLLILDEPTNHLDVWTVDWLEDELRSRSAALLLVTHDRRMLEQLTNRLLELDPAGLDPTGRTDGQHAAAASAGAGVFWHEGGYSVMLEAREERARRRGRAAQQRANLLKKEIAWLRRQPKARTSKPKFREDQALALAAATPAGEVGQLQLGTGRRRLGSQVIDAEAITFRYDGGDRDVIRELSLSVGPGQRLGIVGPNGAGKTTLLRLLLGELEPQQGAVKHGPTVEVGIYRQEASVPPSDVSVLDTIHDVGERIPLANGETLPASKLADRFGFDPKLQRAAVSNLSGGERRRLALLHMLVAAPNVVVLDEPTNDLDLDTLAVLEDHLDGFTGTLIVASHDRFVLDRLTDELLAVEPDGTVTRHMDWERYREAYEHRRALDASGETSRDRPRDTSRAAAAARRASAAEERRKLKAIEAKVAKLTALREQLDAALAAPGTGHEQLAELGKARAAVSAQLDEQEELWLEQAEAVEAATTVGDGSN